MNTTQMSENKHNEFQSHLYMALELGQDNWTLGFSNGDKMRFKEISARSMKTLNQEIQAAKVALDLPETSRTMSCYEAGREGFWLHRKLLIAGIENKIVDSSSIEVNRKARRIKTDKLDAKSLVRMLIRDAHGEHQVWSVLRVPSEQVEDDRRLHRELERLKEEKTSHTNRIGSLLHSQGIVIQAKEMTSAKLPFWSAQKGKPLGKALLGEIRRELGRLELVRSQIKELELEKSRLLLENKTPSLAKVKKLQQLKGIGSVFSWDLVHEFFWREFQNRKEVASAAGLVPSHFQSGKMDHDLGISKAGNRRIRTLMIELSWLWLRYQPQSTLSLWYMQKFAGGSRRLRKVGIVALARKLLIALWKYQKSGLIPEGAVLKPQK